MDLNTTNEWIEIILNNMIKSFIFNHMTIYYYTLSNTKLPEIFFTYNMLDMRGKFKKYQQKLFLL